MHSGAQFCGARNKEGLRDRLADPIRETAFIPRDLKQANHETVGRSIHGTPPDQESGGLCLGPTARIATGVTDLVICNPSPPIQLDQTTFIEHLFELFSTTLDPGLHPR